MLKTRRCFICKTRLSGRLGHGFVSNDGKSVICGDYRRHKRIKRGLKFDLDGEESTTEASYDS